MKAFNNAIKHISFLLILFNLALVTGCHSDTNEKKIGIIIPIEHKAMNEIVSGFEDTLRANTNSQLKFKVANAQGDMNVERAIIQQMKQDNYDLIVPIGTDATQMSGAMIQHQAIISLASSMTENERTSRKTCNIAIVHDEISASQLIQFIHQAYPSLQRMALIHSASDKVFPEVEAAIAAGKQAGITIKPMMASTLNDIYSTANNIPSDTQGIFVIKDSLIVSGISTLKKSAEKRGIPLITSDQGSVQDGAGFSLGVHERDIGVEGAKLAAAILSGKSPCDLPIVEMTKLTVFVNQESLMKQKQSLDGIHSAANKFNYEIENI